MITRFQLTDDAQNELGEWLVVRITHSGQQPQALGQHNAGNANQYQNHFLVMPSSQNWRPTQQQRPHVKGLAHALVVGTEEGEVFCDDQGRVRLHFLWDHASQADDKSTCWVHVSQSFSGGGYGQQMLPRVGHTVVVTFLHNDPNQPLVTGQYYNDVNRPPLDLTTDVTSTMLMKSKTAKGDGSNLIQFEDKADSEKLSIQAQKDLQIFTPNDLKVTVNNQMRTAVTQHQFVQVAKDEHQDIQGKLKQVAQQVSTDIKGELHHKSGAAFAMQLADGHLKAGTAQVLEGMDITLKVGGSCVSISAAGIGIMGAPGLNSGAPLVAEGYQGTAPQAAKGLKAADPAAAEQAEIALAEVPEVQLAEISEQAITLSQSTANTAATAAAASQQDTNTENAPEHLNALFHFSG